MTKSIARLAPYRNPGGVVPERINRRELLSCWRTLFEPGKDLDKLYEMLVVIQTPARARAYHQVRAHPNGRKIFESKPDLLALLEDDEYLASLPVGSVGHAYRSFLTTNRLDAGVYSEAVIRPIAQKNNWSEDYYFSVLRNTALHDVLHTITGYGPDAAGEALALGFFCGQTEPAGPIRLAGLALTIITPGASLRHKLRCFREATERGRRADNIFAAPWEELFEKPLDDVTELLGVASKAAAHPNGTWYTDWMPAGMSSPTAWDYDKVLAQAV